LNERLNSSGSTSHVTQYIEKRAKCFTSTLQRLNPDSMIEGVRNATNYQRGQHAYLRMIAIFIFLVEVENELVRRIIDITQREHVLVRVIEPAFSLLVETAETLVRVCVSVAVAVAAAAVFC
jgi:hypothetical protein